MTHHLGFMKLQEHKLNSDKMSRVIDVGESSDGTILQMAKNASKRECNFQADLLRFQTEL